MKNYRSNLMAHIRHLRIMFLFLILSPVLIYLLLIYRYDNFSLDLALSLFEFGFVIITLPIILLHFNYFISSIGKSFSYDEIKGIMFFESKDFILKFEVNDIKSISCYKSWTLAENRGPLFPWDVYNYATIHLNNGNILKISSLLVDEFDKEIKLDDI